MNCKEAKEIRLVNILMKINAIEKKKTKNEIWYLSPLRNEKDASFKIDIIKNLWYDFGLGKGGNVLDFVMLYYKCNIKEALNIMDNNSFSFHQPESYSGPTRRPVFEILKKQNLQNEALINYLKSRKISFEIARLYCFEIYYKSNGKRYFSIAFQNDSGGFELRNKYYKGCYKKKDITMIINGSKTLNIFEGFIDFLSYLMLKQNKLNENFLITNSTSLTERSIKYLDNYDIVKTFFDNDISGKNATKLIGNNCQNEFRNESLKFEGHKDLNDFLITIS